ncbi:hypothetical protein ACH492_39525 [Streptomyces sp. NPDC019443]|uniref:hypothetical protein n=1 Tax=Streptomyces sp. NPDC019443 TaxID=3365061 RepID=UPI0037B715A4
MAGVSLLAFVGGVVVRGVGVVSAVVDDLHPQSRFVQGVGAVGGQQPLGGYG